MGAFECAEVWAIGATLPEDYDGTCAENDGSVAVSGTIDCADGSTFSTYHDRFYAKLGGKIAAGPNGENDERDETLGAAYDEFYYNCSG